MQGGGMKDLNLPNSKEEWEDFMGAATHLRLGMQNHNKDLVRMSVKTSMSGYMTYTLHFKFMGALWQILAKEGHPVLEFKGQFNLSEWKTRLLLGGAAGRVTTVDFPRIVATLEKL